MGGFQISEIQTNETSNDSTTPNVDLVIEVTTSNDEEMPDDAADRSSSTHAGSGIGTGRGTEHTRPASSPTQRNEGARRSKRDTQSSVPLHQRNQLRYSLEDERTTNGSGTSGRCYRTTAWREGPSLHPTGRDSAVRCVQNPLCLTGCDSAARCVQNMDDFPYQFGSTPPSRAHLEPEDILSDTDEVWATPREHQKETNKRDLGEMEQPSVISELEQSSARTTHCVKTTCSRCKGIIKWIEGRTMCNLCVVEEDEGKGWRDPAVKFPEGRSELEKKASWKGWKEVVGEHNEVWATDNERAWTVAGKTPATIRANRAKAFRCQRREDHADAGLGNNGPTASPRTQVGVEILRIQAKYDNEIRHGHISRHPKGKRSETRVSYYKKAVWSMEQRIRQKAAVERREQHGEPARRPAVRLTTSAHAVINQGPSFSSPQPGISASNAGMGSGSGRSGIRDITARVNFDDLLYQTVFAPELLTIIAGDLNECTGNEEITSLEDYPAEEYDDYDMAPDEGSADVISTYSEGIQRTMAQWYVLGQSEEYYTSERQPTDTVRRLGSLYVGIIFVDGSMAFHSPCETEVHVAAICRDLELTVLEEGDSLTVTWVIYATSEQELMTEINLIEGVVITSFEEEPPEIKGHGARAPSFHSDSKIWSNDSGYGGGKRDIQLSANATSGWPSLVNMVSNWIGQLSCSPSQSTRSQVDSFTMSHSGVGTGMGKGDEAQRTGTGKGTTDNYWDNLGEEPLPTAAAFAVELTTTTYKGSSDWSEEDWLKEGHSMVPVPGSAGNYGEKGTGAYTIETLQRRQYGEGAMQFYQNDPEFISGIEKAMSHILELVLDRNEGYIRMLFTHPHWGVDEKDVEAFLLSMGLIIHRATRSLEERQRTKGGRHPSDLLTFQLEFGTTNLEALFVKQYLRIVQGDGEYDGESSMGQGSSKSSPGNKSSKSPPSDNNRQRAERPPSTQIPRKEDTCEGCGLHDRGQLNLITTPPRELLGRMPKLARLCDGCLIVEMKHNEQDMMTEREIERDFYIRKVKAQPQDTSPPESMIPRRVSFGSRVDGRSSTVQQSQARSEPRGPDQSSNRSPRGNSSASFSRKQDEQDSEEDSAPDLYHKSHSSPYQSQSRSPPREPIPDSPDDQRKFKLQVLRQQADVAEQQMATQVTALEAGKLKDTIAQQKWVEQAIASEKSNLLRHLEVLKDYSKPVPPNSGVVGRAFLEVWKGTRQMCKNMMWPKTKYPWMIYAFAKLLEPTTVWLQGQSIPLEELSHQHWKTEPRRYWNALLVYWGYEKGYKLHNNSIHQIVERVDKSTHSTDVSGANEEIRTILYTMGNIHPDQEDAAAYKDFSLWKSFQLALKDRQGAELILAAFAKQKIQLLRCKYAHVVKKFILELKPWDRDRGETPRGYPQYVQYTAKKWFNRHKQVTQPKQVKLREIQEVMNVKDPHPDAIGTCKDIIIEISSEIPNSESSWERFACTVQNQSWDIYDEESGWSGSFNNLEAFFSYIQEIARAVVGHNGSRSKQPQAVSSYAIGPAQGGIRGNQPLVVAMVKGSGYEQDEQEDYENEGPGGTGSYEHDYDASEGEGEDQHEEEVEAYPTASMQDQQQAHRKHQMDRIWDITGVRKIRADQVITSGEWQLRDDIAEKDRESLPPKTYAGLRYHMTSKYKKGGDTQKKLLARLKQFLQDAVSKLCTHIGKEPVMVADKDMQGCGRDVRDKHKKPCHLQRGSHTDVTCLHKEAGGRYRSSCEDIQKLYDLYAPQIEPELLAQRCEAMGSPQCGKCSESYYTNCAAQRKHHYEVIEPAMLVAEFDILMKYTAVGPNDRKLEDQLSPTELRQLIIVIVMRAFTQWWNVN